MQIESTSKNRRIMSFHAKAFVGFLAFHTVFTGLPLFADHFAWASGAYSEEPYLGDVAAALWVVASLSVSIAGLGLAYLVLGVMRYAARA